MKIKEKIKRIGVSNSVLLITAGVVGIFSLYMFIGISMNNKAANNDCEPRKYVEWNKKIDKPLTEERVIELQKELVTLKQRIQTCEENEGNTWAKFNSRIILCDLFDKDKINEINTAIKNGYMTEMIPDEERRANSRKEVEDYNKCIKAKDVAIKERPERQNGFIFGNIIILVMGVLLATALKNFKLE